MFENSGNPQWEQQTLQNVLLEHVKEQRRVRRWNIFFKLILISFTVVLYITFFNADFSQPVITTLPHAAIINIYGEITAESEANADSVRDALKSAFDNKQVKGVVLRINSPGGSPVQSRQIFGEIRGLRQKFPDIKVYAAIEDIGASGAYLIASAADAIYADKTSLVGSIGAKLDSFGFVEAMHKVGVERRLYTAGKYKGILDPFSPRTPEEDAFIMEQLRTVHNAFIENVKEGRGSRLKNSPDIFSGLFWSGEQALQLGLTDGYGDAQFITKELIKVENLIDYTTTVNLLDKITKKIGTSFGETFLMLNQISQKGFN